MEHSPTILYETLSPLPLSLSLSPPSPSSPPPPSPPPQSEPYTVFRNEITLTDIRSSSLDSPAPDFFSLDINPPPEFALESTAKTPPPPPSPKPAEPAAEHSWFRGNTRFKSPMLQLHKEIVDFCDFLSPNPEEQALRNAAVESVFDVIKYIWPYSKPEVFGSFKTGLYLPTSDIDVVIMESGIKVPQVGLHALSKALSQRGIAKKIKVIGKARVPIIKFVEKRSGVSFDISFDLQNGLKAAEYIKEALSKWPPLRPLCLILKVFLQQRELNEVYSGGIGSYALLTMLMAVLQNFHRSQASAEQNLGILLVHFFDIYGRKLNINDVGVSCNGAGTFFKKSNKGFANNGKPFLISIEDPQAPDNDIGKNSYNYFQIRSAFVMAFTTLTNPKTILSLGPNRSILGTIIRPDPVLMERKGGSNGEVTFNSLLPGAGELLQTNNGDKQEIVCNWLSDYDEESFPRGDGSARSSGKKRKASSKSRKKKKAKTLESEKQEESGSQSRKKKKEKTLESEKQEESGSKSRKKKKEKTLESEKQEDSGSKSRKKKKEKTLESKKQEESGSRKDKGKKKRCRHNRRDVNGAGMGRGFHSHSPNPNIVRFPIPPHSPLGAATGNRSRNVNGAGMEWGFHSYSSNPSIVRFPIPPHSPLGAVTGNRSRDVNGASMGRGFHSHSPNPNSRDVNGASMGRGFHSHSPNPNSRDVNGASMGRGFHSHSPNPNIVRFPIPPHSPLGTAMGNQSLGRGFPIPAPTQYHPRIPNSPYSPLGVAMGNQSLGRGFPIPAPPHHPIQYHPIPYNNAIMR